jgi:hypothetical protein
MSNLEFLCQQSFLGKISYVPNLKALTAEKNPYVFQYWSTYDANPPVFGIQHHAATQAPF